MRLPKYEMCSIPWIIVVAFGSIILTMMRSAGYHISICIIALIIFDIVAAMVYDTIKKHEDIKHELKELQKELGETNER